MLKNLFTISLGTFILTTCISACAIECNSLSSAFDYKPYSKEVTLDISEVASLPSNTVLAGGAYFDASHVIHPALFLSTNAGKDWREEKLFFPAHGISAIETYGLNHIWVLVNFQQEGQDFPKYLVSSSDGGKSWCQHSLDFIKFADSQLYSSGIKFYNHSNGVLWLQGSSGNHVLYSTNDGGKKWRQLFSGERDGKFEIDNQYEFPDTQLPKPHAPLWTKQLDFYKITGLLRAVKKTKQYSIQSFDYSNGSGWPEISTINRNRVITENGLQ